MSTMPYVIEQTGEGERSYDTRSRLLSDRITLLGEEVSDIFASLIIAQLLFLRSTDPDKDIQLYINNPGGSMAAGWAVYDTMQYIKYDALATCLGLAVSFGIFLLVGGTHGKRMALLNPEIMMYQSVIYGNGVQGPASDIKIMPNYMQKSRQRLDRALAMNIGCFEEEVAGGAERDNLMSVEEALKHGLIDSTLMKR